MELPRISARGLLLIPDPHVAAVPPGRRLEGYCEQILAKLAACLEHAAAEDLVPVILGDLFHWPRENPNHLLVRLIGLFRPHRPFALVGNHDKYQARFTEDVSLAVLAAAGAVRLLDTPGPAFHLDSPTGRAIVGASPDAAPIPLAFDRTGGPEAEEAVWLTHHNVGFPDFENRQVKIREIPGVDWVINGHIHRPQPTQVRGGTKWVNPGNISRLTFSPRALTRIPAASVWTPGLPPEQTELLAWPVPFLPFVEVFPDEAFPPEEEKNAVDGSSFVDGLERLSWKRTAEGLGIKEFLSVNVNPELPESDLIWELYHEAVNGRSQDEK